MTQTPPGIQHIDGVQPASTPEEAIRRVLQVLDVQRVPAEAAGEDLRGDRTVDDLFTGTSYRPPWGRIFGGQVLAQSLVAAIRTVDPERPVHSLHAYFLRPGDPDVPLLFAVERLRDGRSFSARRTHAIQNGRPILSMISSFQTPARGMDHQAEMPSVTPPEDLPSMEDLFGHLEIPAVQQTLRSRPVDLRHVDGPLYLEPAKVRADHQAVWMRTPTPLPDDPAILTAMLAYASDYSLLESIIRRHGLAWSTPGMRTASLDHAMWFHRPARLDDWMLYAQQSPSAIGARGLALGRMYTRDGTLAVSTAQEGMIRVPEDQLDD